MSFAFNEIGLHQFFTGAPMRRFLDAEAEKVTAQARTNAKSILHRFTGSLDGDIDYALLEDEQSLYAKIGIVNPNTKFGGYLDEKEQREHGWLEPALRLEGLRP